MHVPDYCRQIETYLCRKNDGHLIRVVGPAFDVVSRWAAEGVPLRVAWSGIDRSFERYHRKGPRRRPLRIEFCEADVLDVFDDWRRAVGLASEPRVAEEGGRSGSLPAHLERALLRLSEARAGGALGPEADPTIDAVSAELDAARASPRGVRGEARQRLLERLGALDHDLVVLARSTVDAKRQAALEAEADDELAAFRERLPPEAYVRARAAAIDRLVRERLKLPTLAFS